MRGIEFHGILIQIITFQNKIYICKKKIRDACKLNQIVMNLLLNKKQAYKGVIYAKTAQQN